MSQNSPFFPFKLFSSDILLQKVLMCAKHILGIFMENPANCLNLSRLKFKRKVHAIMTFLSWEMTFWRNPCTFPFSCQTVKTMDPQKIKFPQKSHTGRRRSRRTGIQSLRKRLHTVCQPARPPCRTDQSQDSDGSVQGRTTPWAGQLVSHVQTPSIES